MNGRLGNVNNTGDFTCYKENGASVVDYLICQPSCMHLITEFSILSKRATCLITVHLVLFCTALPNHEMLLYAQL